MSIGITLINSDDVTIIGATTNGWSTAVHAHNTNALTLNGLKAQNCEKGIVLDNCWDSNLAQIDIETKKSMGYFRIKSLPYSIRCSLYGKALT